EGEPAPGAHRCGEGVRALRDDTEEVSGGKAEPKDNVLKNAPHTAEMIADDEWTHPYSRRKAAYPLGWVAARKVWPAVARIDNPYGDRNLFCVCPPVDEYAM